MVLRRRGSSSGKLRVSIELIRYICLSEEIGFVYGQFTLSTQLIDFSFYLSRNKTFFSDFIALVGTKIAFFIFVWLM